MSVAIATLGMFTPAAGGTRTVVVDRGSSYGAVYFKRKKPVVVVDYVKDENGKTKPSIYVTSLEET